MAMKKIVVYLTFFIIANCAQAQMSFFDTHFQDFSENLQTAIDENKAGIFVFFHLEDCPFCHKMRQTVLNQNAIISFYKKHFLNYEVDANGNLEVVNFAGETVEEKKFATLQNNIFATPVLAFFDLSGKLIAKRTGYVPTDEFLLFGRYVLEKAYQKENFTRYKLKHKYKRIL